MIPFVVASASLLGLYARRRTGVGQQIFVSMLGANTYANADAFVDGWYRTGDEGFFDTDGYLTLTGRIKEVINRGGEKVSPAEVDATLIAHPDVVEAATFPVPHPSLGEIPAAAVVLKAGSKVSEEALVRFLRERLANFKVPARIVFLDEIPKSAVGKIQRGQLPRVLGIDRMIGGQLHQDTAKGREPTELEYRLQRLWKKALRVEHVGLNDNFFMLGGDSLQALELFLQIEREIGRRVPLSILYEATTVAEMAACIEKNDRPEIVFPIQSKGHRPPFFSVHTTGGEILDQMSLSRHLGEDQPFYALQAIGDDGKEMPITRMEELAAGYIEAIKSVQPQGPYFIGGPYSGGIVAYEMARQLKAAGEEVALLALIHSNLGGVGPPLVPPVRFWGLAFRRWVLKHWSRMSGFKLSQIPGYAAHRFYRLYTVHGLPLRYRLYGFLISYYRSRGRTAPTWLHRPLEVGTIRLKNYAPQPYDGDAVLFRAEISYENNEEQVAKWKELVRGRLEVRFIPGLHDDILREPHIHRLATELADCIERCLTVHKAVAGPDDLSADLDQLPAQRGH